RVAREIEAQRLLLVAQAVDLRPFTNPGVDRGTRSRRRCEQRTLPRLALLPALLRMLDELFDRGAERGARHAQAVEGAGLDQAVEDLLVELLRVELHRDVRDAVEAPDAAAGGE